MADLNLKMLMTLKDKASPELNKFKKNLNETKSSLVGFAGKIAGLVGIGAIAKGVFDVNVEFEKLQKSLKTVTGSADEAEQAFKFIQDIASGLPESVQDVTTAFIRMKSLGLVPTREAITSFANTASAMGKDLMQFVEAVADAATGEFERLKEFGIKARSEGENVAFTFQGVTTTVKKNATDITNYLQSIGEVQFAGAAAEQMDTISGKMSNLSDSLAKLAKKLGDSGLTAGFKIALSYAIDFVDTILQNFDLIEFAWIDAGTAIIRGWLEIKRYVSIVVQGILLTWDKMIASMANAWDDFIGSIQSTANKIADFIGLDPVFDTVRDGTRATMEYGDIVSSVNAEIDEQVRILNESGEARKRETAEKYKAAAVTSDYNEKLKEEKEAQDAAAAATENSTKKTKEKLSVYQRLIKDIEEQRVQTEQAWDAQDQLDAAFAAGTITADEYQMALKEVNDILGIEYPEATDKAKDKTDEMGEHLKQAARSMQQNFSDFFFDIMQGDFNDLAANFKRTIDRMVADLLASQLFELLIGDFGSSGNLGGVLGGLFGGFRAEGGPVQKGVPYVVGEKRAELFVPDTNGRILPNAEQALSEMGVAPNGNNVSINITAMDSQDVKRALEGQKRWLADLVGNTTRTFNMGY